MFSAIDQLPITQALTKSESFRGNDGGNLLRSIGIMIGIVQKLESGHVNLFIRSTLGAGLKSIDILSQITQPR